MDSAISIRLSADADDRAALGGLAGLEDRPELTGPVLLAEEDGHPVAAVELVSAAWRLA